MSTPCPPLGPVRGERAGAWREREPSRQTVVPCSLHHGGRAYPYPSVATPPLPPPHPPHSHTRAANNTGSGEWFWWEWKGLNDPSYANFVAATESPQWTYADYAPRFQAEFFDPAQWAALFKASGARYVVPTSKHHEGFTNWPSATSFNWNSVDVGPHRDLIGELGAAVKAAGLVYGVYHSLFEWFNPAFLADKSANFTANITSSAFLQKTFGELRDLVERYQPELIWSDGDLGPDAYWSAPSNFLAWLVNESPVKDTVVFNDRWGTGDSCLHGSYWTCQDRYLPSKTQGRKWENAFTIDRKSWGFRRNGGLADYLSTAEVVHNVVATVSLGGNALINVRVLEWKRARLKEVRTCP